MKRQLRRRLAHGGNATLVTVMVVVLVGLLYGVADRNRVRWDLSADESNRLQADTVNKLALLDAEGREVVITAFTAQQGKADSYFKNRAMKDLLEELDYHSSVVRWRQVDFDRERLTAESLGVTDYGTLVLQRGDERVDLRDRDLFRRTGRGDDRRLEFLGEAAFNRAATQLMSRRKRVIYSLRGHGERDADERGPGGLSELGSLLDQENYELEPLDFFRDREGAEAPAVPEDAAAVLVARPLAALSPPEESALVNYLGNGGSLMLLSDPRSAPLELLTRLGIDEPPGVVADRVLIFPYNDRPVPRYRSHPITSDLADARIVTVLAHIAPLRVSSDAPAWSRFKTVLETSRDGWIELGGELDGGAAVFQPEIDVKGPVAMAMAGELEPAEDGIVLPGRSAARVVVVGDSDWLTNQLLAEGPGNGSFAVNAFRWLLRDDARLSVIGRPTKVRRLALTAEDQGMIRWLVMGLMPLVVVLIGGAVWAGRRGR